MPKSEKTGETATATAERPKARAGRPPKSEDRIPKVMGFFKRVQLIQKEDWGTRAFITVYRLEPSIDRTRLGEPKHIAKYSEPIDEDRIKSDQGSGRYRLYLGFKSPTEKTEKEIDSIEVDILDMNFPPKLAKGEWLDIPYNKKWEWCRTLLPDMKDAAQPQKTGASEMLESFQVFSEVQAQAAERAGAKDSTLDIIRAVKELTPPPPPSTENAMLQTVVTLMTTQINAAQEQAKELRDEMREMRKQPQAPPTTALGTLKEIITEAKTLLPDLKEMFPGFGERVSGAARAVRSNMTGDQEFWQPVVTRILEAVTPAVPFFVQKLMTPNLAKNEGQPATAPAGLTPPPPTNGAPQQQQPGAAAPPQQQPQPFNPREAFEFLNQHAEPFTNWFKDSMSGSDFAASLFNLYGAKWHELPWLHAKATYGTEQIVGLFKRSPLWPEIANQEARFTQFVADFVAWTPGEEEPSEPQTIDTTAEHVEERN